MKQPVYLLRTSDENDDEDLCRRLERLILDRSLFDFINENDLVPIKTHFGEKKNLGFVRPLHLAMLGRLLAARKALPFLTETSTLYKGDRTNAVLHSALAQRHGFGQDATGLPLIMADGILGDEEVEVEIPGRIYRRVKIAALMARVQALVAVSHFTGHLAAGFGACLKNLGMGLSSRRGKMIQHSTAKPRVMEKQCTGCGVCVRWCPANAITLGVSSAVIDGGLCIGCGQCLAMCRFDAVGYNWGATYEELQKKVVEHALGVATILRNNALYINFLTRISKDCDCMHSYENIVPPVGVLVSRDPVAIDAASLDLVEALAGKKLSELSYDIPYRFQIDYAREIGFGNPDYEMIEV